jgi:hypothetical protein
VSETQDLGATASQSPVSVREHLDIVREGTVAIERVASIVGRGSAAQFIHKYVRDPDNKYRVQHVRDECEFCDALDVVYRALEGYHDLASDTAVATKAPPPEPGPESSVS